MNQRALMWAIGSIFNFVLLAPSALPQADGGSVSADIHTAAGQHAANAALDNLAAGCGRMEGHLSPGDGGGLNAATNC